MAYSPGQVFAGYTIESVLGTGGMGSVYLAKHPRLPRKDALKLLSSALSTDESFRIRFEREADLAARLIHRNIVAVYDRGSADGQLWIAMQHVAGSDAAQAAPAKDGSMTPERVVHIVSEVGVGLDFAHRNGLLHRDVKPANILLAPPDDPDDPETVLLTDFGIAKPMDEVQHLTGTGNMLATLAYASPEQIEAKHIDRRVDIYALGCVLYELLTGSVPFPEESPFATMSAHLKKDPPKPSEAVPGLPVGFDAVVAKAMAKNRDDRYNTCRELTNAAKAVLAGPKTATVEKPATVVSPPTVLGPSPYAPAPLPYSAPKAAPSNTASGATGARPPFQILVHRAAGSTGPTSELGPILTQNLAHADRAAIEDLIGRARFFDLPNRLPLERIMNDDAFLEVTISSAQVTRSVGYEKLGSRHPPELDELVSRLENLANWHAPSPARNQAIPNQPPGQPGQHLSGPQGGPSNRDWSAAPSTGTGQHPGYSGHHSGGFDRPAALVGPTPVPNFTGNHVPGNGFTGQHPAVPQSLTGVQQLSGPSQVLTGQTGTALVHGSTTGAATNTKKWIGIGLVAVLVMVVTVVVLVLTTGSSDNGNGNGNAGGGGTTSSTEEVGKVPVTPTGLVFSPDNSTYTISWDLTAGAEKYELKQGDETVYTGTDNYYKIDLEPGIYEFSVAAINAAGTSGFTDKKELEVGGTETTGPTDPVTDWGDNAYMIEAFPELLPATPSDTGFNSMTCENAEPSASIGADGYIICTDPDDVSIQIVHFTSEQAKSDFLATKTYDVTDTWHRSDGVDAGMIYRTGDTVKPGIIWTEFSDAGLTEYVIAATWEQHTTKELMDGWWANAQF